MFVKKKNVYMYFVPILLLSGNKNIIMIDVIFHTSIEY